MKAKLSKRALTKFKTELTSCFVKLFRKLPELIKERARNSYKLWKENPNHPVLEFKKIRANGEVYSVRIGIGWRVLGTRKKDNTIVWFWIGSHQDYDNLV